MRALVLCLILLSACKAQAQPTPPNSTNPAPIGGLGYLILAASALAWHQKRTHRAE